MRSTTGASRTLRRTSLTRPSRTTPKPSASIRLRNSTTTAVSHGGRRKSTTRRSRTANEAIGLDPNHAAAYSTRGHCWSDKKDFDKAIADYDVAIRLNPTARWYINRGNAWLNK